VAPAEELAAGALVAATLSLQSDAAVDAQLAELTQDDPTSLERVLREPTPPPPAASLRQGGSFSFEQFFRQPAEQPQPSEPAPQAPGAPRGGAPAAAPQSADDDLEDFHAWLAGLSKS